MNMEITITASERSASARTFGFAGRLVARHDQQPDRVGLLCGLLVRAGRPRVGDAAAVRRGGNVEGAAAVLAREAETLGERTDACAAAAARARPDEDGALCACQRGVVDGVHDRRAPCAARRAPTGRRSARSL